MIGQKQRQAITEIKRIEVRTPAKDQVDCDGAQNPNKLKQIPENKVRGREERRIKFEF